LEKQLAVAGEGPVREQFGDELKARTGVEQDSKALKSAKRQLLFDRIIEEVELPFPVGGASVDPETGEPLPASKDSQTRSQVKKACESIYKDLVRQKIAVDKRRPDGRGAEEIRPTEVEVGVNPRAPGPGAVRQRRLEALTPTPDECPHTIRIVSETLESNGSSSMGSVCGSTLSLMDAGVPLKAPVSGIAMGLVKEGDDYVILTDIQGA